MDSLDGEEKKDASKEDLEQEEGKILKCSKIIYWVQIISNSMFMQIHIFTNTTE